MSLPQISFAEIEYQFAHASDDRRGSLLATCISLAVLCCGSVALRLWARRIQKLRLAWNDYFIMISLVFILAMISVVLYGIKLGFGKHVVLVGIAGAEEAAKLLYVLEAMFPTTNSLVKMSVLVLYHSIFGHTHNRMFGIALRIVGAGWLSIMIISTCTGIFQCSPIHYAWTTDHKVGCLNTELIVLILTSIVVALNTATLVLPLPLIWQLKLPLTKKLGVLLLFIIGVGDIAVSIFRASTTRTIKFTDIDVTYKHVPTIQLLLLEPALGLILANLTTLLPIFRLPFFAPLWRAVARMFPGLKIKNERFSKWTAPIRISLSKVTGSGLSSERTRVGDPNDDPDAGFEMDKGRYGKDLEAPAWKPSQDGKQRNQPYSTYPTTFNKPRAVQTTISTVGMTAMRPAERKGSHFSDHAPSSATLTANSRNWSPVEIDFDRRPHTSHEYDTASISQSIISSLPPHTPTSPSTRYPLGDPYAMMDPIHSQEDLTHASRNDERESKELPPMPRDSVSSVASIDIDRRATTPRAVSPMQHKSSYRPEG